MHGTTVKITELILFI